MCVCGHPKSAHRPVRSEALGEVLECRVEVTPNRLCPCGPGCIHEGFVDASGAPVPNVDTRAMREMAEATKDVAWFSQRGTPVHTPGAGAHVPGLAKAVVEAADEIDRLRKRIDELGGDAP
jgi:hypothetical protein